MTTIDFYTLESVKGPVIIKMVTDDLCPDTVCIELIRDDKAVGHADIKLD